MQSCGLSLTSDPQNCQITDMRCWKFVVVCTAAVGNEHPCHSDTMMTPIHKGGNCGTERMSNLPKETQLRWGEKSRSEPRPPALESTLVTCSPHAEHLWRLRGVRLDVIYSFYGVDVVSILTTFFHILEKRMM